MRPSRTSVLPRCSVSFIWVQCAQVFIFAGKHALEVAPEGRLKQVIDRMRPLLRAGDYDQALEQAVVDLGLVLAGGEPQQEGEGSFWGLGIFLSIFAGIVGFTSWYIIILNISPTTLPAKGPLKISNEILSSAKS